MPNSDFDDQAEALGALVDPVRRALYRHLVGQSTEVSRDDAARAVGISRILAAFHLDRLVAAGLLEATYRRLSGRTGPGAGRTSKLYRRARREFRVVLPERRYELIARLFAEALEAGPRETASTTLTKAADKVGARLASEAVGRARMTSSGQGLLEEGLRVLTEYGFEPCREGDSITLRNCPFDALAREHPDLVCGANFALIHGFLDALPASGLRASPEPSPGRCCVRLHTVPAS